MKRKMAPLVYGANGERKPPVRSETRPFYLRRTFRVPPDSLIMGRVTAAIRAVREDAYLLGPDQWARMAREGRERLFAVMGPWRYDEARQAVETDDGDLHLVKELAERAEAYLGNEDHGLTPAADRFWRRYLNASPMAKAALLSMLAIDVLGVDTVKADAARGGERLLAAYKDTRSTRAQRAMGPELQDQMDRAGWTETYNDADEMRYARAWVDWRFHCAADMPTWRRRNGIGRHNDSNWRKRFQRFDLALGFTA